MTDAMSSSIVEGDRGRRGGTFTLLTPDNRYVSRLPNLPGARVYKLATPRIAPARFGEYLVVAPAEGVTGRSSPAMSTSSLGAAAAPD